MVASEELSFAPDAPGYAWRCSHLGTHAMRLCEWMGVQDRILCGLPGESGIPCKGGGQTEQNKPNLTKHNELLEGGYCSTPSVPAKTFGGPFGRPARVPPMRSFKEIEVRRVGGSSRVGAFSRDTGISS